MKIKNQHKKSKTLKKRIKIWEAKVRILEAM